MKSPGFRKFVLMACSVLILFVLFNYVLMPYYVNAPGEVALASTIGMTYEEAAKVLDAAGLTVLQGDTRSDARYPIGTVIGQHPLPGKTVNRGRRVYLTVSGGEKLVIVPNVKGRSSRDARFQLEREGLTLGEIEYESSPEFPTGTVIRQRIPAGTSVKKESAVPVVISKGNSPDSLLMPELTGKTLIEATSLLKTIGLTVGNVSYKSSTTMLPNTVMDFFPRAGSVVTQGQAVDFILAGEPVQEGDVLEN